MPEEDRTEKRKRSGAPDWAMGSIESAVEELELIDRVLHLSMTGISVLRGMPGVVKAIQRVKDQVDESEEQTLARAQEQAELAEREVTEDFPLLHAQAVLSVCAVLEATVRHLVAAWLRNDPSVLQTEHVLSLKVELGHYETLDSEDRSYYVMDLLGQKLAARLQGVSRFEGLLGGIGLSEPVDDELRRVIFEMFKVRNVLLHKNGIVDRKLTQECPWLGLSVGEQLRVGHRMLERYFVAAHEYLVNLVYRVGERFGVDFSGERAEQVKRLAKELGH